MNYVYTLLALDLANERSREAEVRRLQRLARDDREDVDGYDRLPEPGVSLSVRRGLARGAAAISLGAAAAARRLDDGVADDLGRSIALAD